MAPASLFPAGRMGRQPPFPDPSVSASSAETLVSKSCAFCSVLTETLESQGVRLLPRAAFQDSRVFSGMVRTAHGPSGPTTRLPRGLLQ